MAVAHSQVKDRIVHYRVADRLPFLLALHLLILLMTLDDVEMSAIPLEPLIMTRCLLWMLFFLF
jgi:hypothetical protein